MKQQLTIVILAILAVLSYWLMTDLEKSLAPEIDDSNVKEIAVARGVKGLYFGANNQLKYDIDSASVREFSNLGGTHLTEADVRALDDKQGVAWTGQAKVVKLSADKETLDLSGGVQLVKAPNSPDPLRATGEHIVYYADKKEAFSDQRITIENNTSYQTSEQLTLDFANNVAHFQGGVRIHHQSAAPRAKIPAPLFRLPRYPYPFFPYPYRLSWVKAQQAH